MRYIRESAGGWTMKVYDMDDLEEAVSFHGHLCPMFYLGVRMGKHALKKLERGRERGIKLHTVLEFVNCFGDGIQYVTGATFGKNNLHSVETGKFASSFYDLTSENSLRITMKNDVVKKVLEHGTRGKEVKLLPPSERENEVKKLMAAGKDVVDWLKELTDEELFESVDAPPFTSDEGPSLDSVMCKKCGELTLIEYMEKCDEGPLCRSCYG